MFLRLLFSAESIKALIGVFADFPRIRCLWSAAVHEECADEANDRNQGNGVGCSDCIHCSKTPSNSEAFSWNF